jgi:hypothetical protein
MKKIFIVFILCLISICSFGQSINYSYPYVEEYGWAFHVPNKSIGELGFIHIECDNKGNIWLKHNVITPYNVEELVDSEGRHVIAEYAINKGKHIYLKLDNNEIITLTCSLMKKVHSGYYTGNTNIYNQYDIFSYFNLNDEIINKLKNNKIIKMRCEMKFEILDMELKDEISLSKNFDKFQTAILEKKNKEIEKNKIKENPLSNF